MQNSGMILLQLVAERVLSAYLRSAGASNVEMPSGSIAHGADRGVDITYVRDGAPRRVKVKADPYFGTDVAKINDRSRVFYRATADSYAFEAVASTATHTPGWIFSSPAEEIFYYRVALVQQEDEIRALLSEPDEVFFSELAVERDELQILQMPPVREWFGAHYEEYAPRPVMLGGGAAWYRLVPRRDIEGAVAGISTVGAVFAHLRRS